MTLLTSIAVSLLASAVSTFCYLVLLTSFDRHEKEPWPLMGFAFVWGAVPAVLLALFAEAFVAASLPKFVAVQDQAVFFTAVAAPIIEEVAKAVALIVIFVRYRQEFDGLLDGLLYGSLAGFGFAMTENVIYFVGSFHQDAGLGAQVVFLRSLVFGLNHALYCSCLGLGLAVARFARRSAVRVVAPALGLAAGIALHMFHNFSVMTDDNWLPVLISNWSGVAVWLLLMGWAIYQESRCMRQELRDEVEAGIITQRDWRVISRNRKRVITKLAAIRQDSAERLNHYLHLIAELAFKKRQLRIHPHDQATGELVQQLRAEILDMRSQTGM